MQTGGGVSPASTRGSYRPGRLQHLCSMGNRDREIRAREAREDREVHSDDFSTGIEYRSAGPARGCLRVVDELIGAGHAKMTLRDQRSNELSSCKFLHQFLGVVAGRLSYLVERRLVDPRQDPLDAGGVTDQHDWAARDRALPIDHDRFRMA